MWRKKTYITYIALIMLLRIAMLVFLPTFLKDFILSTFKLNPVVEKLLVNVVFEILLLSFALFEIYRLKLDHFSRLRVSKSSFCWSDLKVFSLPFLLCLPGTFGQEWGIFTAEQMFLYLVFYVLVGLQEEFFYRGLILPCILKNTGRLYPALVISSVLFGLAHYISMIKNNASFDALTGLVIFATVFGFFCGALMLRTRNLIAIGLLHALFDLAYSGDMHSFLSNTTTARTMDAGVEMNTLSYIMSYGMLAAIFFAAVLIMRSVKQREVVEKLEGA